MSKKHMLGSQESSNIMLFSGTMKFQYLIFHLFYWSNFIAGWLSSENMELPCDVRDSVILYIKQRKNELWSAPAKYLRYVNLQLYLQTKTPNKSKKWPGILLSHAYGHLLDNYWSPFS